MTHVAETTVVAAVIIGLILFIFAAFLFYLEYRNRHPKPQAVREAERSKLVKYARIFIVDIFLEIIGVVFAIYGAVGLQTYNWGKLDMHDIRICFYVFQGLKILLLVFAIFSEHVNDELDDKITHKLSRFGIRSDWKEILESLIFIPNVVIDGMMTNAEFQVGDTGNIFNGDGIILMVIDNLLWIKLCVRLLLTQYSSRGNPPYQVKQFAYALVIFGYSVVLVFFYFILHADAIRSTGMTVTPNMAIVLINALTHTYICSYSSMMSPGILMLDKALRGSDARIKQLKIFITYLRFSPISVIFTLGFLAYTAWVYVSIFTVSFLLTTGFSADSSDILQGVIYTITVLVDGWTLFLMANLGYAVLKRFGAYFGLRKPFPDCSTYAEQINSILGQCSASFRMDSRGQIR